MYQQEGDQFVRVKTPESFDRLANRLENDDSVLFQSINLSGTGRLSTTSISSSDPLNSTGENPKDSNETTDQIPVHSISLKPDDDDEDDELLQSQDNSEINTLTRQIRQLEAQIEQKKQRIIEKDQKIAELEKELDKVKKTQRPKTASPTLQLSDQDQRYKDQYERYLFELNNLKEALAQGGQVTKIKGSSLHPVKPV